MGTRRGLLRLLLAAVLLAGAATACGSGDATTADEEGESMIEYDERMSSAIVQLSRRGESRRLAELTSFAWDRVYVYSEGAKAADINRDVGEELLRGERFYTAGNLFVFMRDGSVHRARTATPDLISWEGANRFSPAVDLVPLRPGRSSGLVLKDPNQS